jgi:hypothetical protein
MTNSDRRTTRRNVLRLGATAASATLVGTALGTDPADASPAGSGSSADFAATGRVRDISGSKVDLDLLAGLSGAAAHSVVGRASMPLVGFSSDALPRIGDLVAVSKTTPGYDLAAAPMVHYVKGTPRASRGGGFAIATERIADHPALQAAAEAGKPVTVSVFDTHLPDAKVFAVLPVDGR